MEHTVRPRPAQSTRIRSLRPRREPPPSRRVERAERATLRDRIPAQPDPAQRVFPQTSKRKLTSLFFPTSAARRALRRGDPEQGQGEEAREAPADPDRDHGGGGEGEAGEEGGQEGSQGASPIPTFAPLFPSQHRNDGSLAASDFSLRFTTRQTDPLVPSRLVVSSFRRRPRRRLASNARSSRRTAAPPRS